MFHALALSFALLGPVQPVEATPLDRLAEQIDPPVIAHFAAGATITGGVLFPIDPDTLNLGAGMEEGAPAPGLYIAFADVEILAGDEPHTLPPGAVLSFHLATVLDCSVTCGAGFYACCNVNSCTCIRTGNPGDCESGGPGSVACSHSWNQEVPEW
jgi:hypothetical protein